MSTKPPFHFITASEMEVEELPWGPHEWLCRPGLTEAKALLLVRVRMPPGQGHAVSSTSRHGGDHLRGLGPAEQWVDRSVAAARSGESRTSRATSSTGPTTQATTPLVFLAILSPAIFEGPALVDASREEPWASLRPTSASGVTAP